MISATDLLNERNALATHHSAMKSLWDDAQRLASPVGPEYLANDVTAPRLVRQLSAVAVQDNKDLAAGLMAWILPETANWWKWQPVRALRGRPGVVQWLHECSEIAHDILRGSNFYTEAFSLMLQRNTSGTGTLWMRTMEQSDLINGTWTDDSPLHFEMVPASNIMVSEDSRGIVHRWFRTVMFSARQALQEFGDKAPEHAKVAASKPSSSETKAEYLHVIYKRQKPDGPTAAEQMPWASVWVCPKSKQILKTSGYLRQPIFTTRYERWSRQSPYGVSPAMVALGEIRGVNYFEMLLTTLAEVAVEPRVQAPADHDGIIDLGPGGVTRVMDANSAPKEWAPAGELKWGMEFLDRKEKRIHEIFLKDVFAQFSMLERQMTAFEVAQRQTEKLARVVPATSLMTNDLFNPLLDALFHWCYQTRQFPDAPADAWVTDSLGRPKMPYPQVIQTNRLAREQSAETEQAVMRLLGVLSPAVEIAGPGVFDPINFDKLARSLAVEMGLKSELIRTPEEEQSVKQQRAQAQAAQVAAEMAVKNPELAVGAAQAMA